MVKKLVKAPTMHFKQSLLAHGGKDKETYLFIKAFQNQVEPPSQSAQNAALRTTTRWHTMTCQNLLCTCRNTTFRIKS